jgi:hypothetical protein
MEESRSLFLQLGLKAQTDKVTHHGYHRFYPQYLEPIRLAASGMLEIGVLEQASSYLWKDYFPKAHIYGVDIGDKVSNDPRITYLKADQSVEKDLLRVIQSIQHPVQFIIDDGSHIPQHQIATFNLFFDKLLQPGGVYIVEDIETSYWTKGGLYGYATRYGYKHPESFVEQAKDIIDIINSEFCQQKPNLHRFSPTSVDMIKTITFGQNCVIFTKKNTPDYNYSERQYRFGQFL